MIHQPPVSEFFRRLRHYLVPLVAVSLSALSAHANALAVDAELAYTHDDNVTRSPREVDVLKDSFVSVSAGLSFLQWLDRNHRLVYRGFLRGEKYDKYDGLSNATLGGQITYQYRASGQFTAPTYGAFFRAAIVEYDSELRDSNLFSLGVSWRKPVTDRITFLAQLAGNYRDSDSTAFDTKEVSLLANIDYALGSRWTLYHTLNLIEGDIVSTVNASYYPSLYIVNAAETINIDDAFPNTGATRTAYRLNATTIVAALGTNFRINEQHSLDLSARFAHSEADADIEYDRWIISFAYLARF